jgi:hypothetical protein
MYKWVTNVLEEREKVNDSRMFQKKKKKKTVIILKYCIYNIFINNIKFYKL